MSKKILFAAFLVAVVAACATKEDVVYPDTPVTTETTYIGNSNSNLLCLLPGPCPWPGPRLPHLGGRQRCRTHPQKPGIRRIRKLLPLSLSQQSIT